MEVFLAFASFHSIALFVRKTVAAKLEAVDEKKVIMSNWLRVRTGDVHEQE